MRCPVLVVALSTLYAATALAGPRSIVDGERSSLAAVGALLEAGAVRCTATWIGGPLLLTAGHCLDGARPTEVFLGDDVAAGGRTVAIAGEVTHPDYQGPGPADVAVVVLAEPLTADELGPPPVLADSAPAVGDLVRFVGFGWTTGGIGAEEGVRRQRLAAITALEPERFRYGVATCFGDSGGPAFASGGDGPIVVGVTSAGDATCAVYGVDTRIDVHHAWLASIADLCAADDRRERCPALWIREPEAGGCHAAAGGGPAAALVPLLLLLALPVRRRSRRQP